MSFGLMFARVALLPFVLVATRITMLVWKGTHANYSRVMRWTVDNILVYLHPLEAAIMSVIFPPLTTFVENSPPELHSAETWFSNGIALLYFWLLWIFISLFSRE